jgi:hypothetical protein
LHCGSRGPKALSRKIQARPAPFDAGVACGRGYRETHYSTVHRPQEEEEKAPVARSAEASTPSSQTASFAPGAPPQWVETNIFVHTHTLRICFCTYPACIHLWPELEIVHRFPGIPKRVIKCQPLPTRQPSFACTGPAIRGSPFVISKV